jgi:hypothetical protein
MVIPLQQSSFLITVSRVVLNWVCDALCVDPQSQTRRIERTPSIADELVMVKVLAKRGGMQDMVALTLRGFPTWILGIHPSELKDDNPEEAERTRQMIIAYQMEAVDVLYNHFAQKSRLALPVLQTIVPAEPVKPAAPQSDASSDIWIKYHQQMIQWHQWKQEMEVWQNETEQWKKETRSEIGEIKSEVGDLKEKVRSILTRFTLSSEHKDTATTIVRRVARMRGLTKPDVIWSDLNRHFRVKHYYDIPDDQWAEVQEYLQKKINEALKTQGPSLFDESQDSQ